jgi:NADPH:quinone reductase-like Zn-dependent oxidoreductase
VRALGAEPVVEGDRVGAQLASRPLDAVIDTIGGDALESTCEALRPNGIIVSVVRAPDEVYLRSKGVRAAYFIVDVTRYRLDRISAMIERGTLNLPVGEVLELADASTAHRMLDGAPHKPGLRRRPGLPIRSHSHRDNSRRRSNLVAFGAKRT